MLSDYNKPLRCGDRAEDLENWASRLEAIGKVISIMAADITVIPGQHEAFMPIAEHLGHIIQDYARP